MIPTLVLFAFSLLVPLKADHVILWKLSILAMEYGHWFALATIVTAAYPLLKRRGAKRVLATCLALVAVFFFLTPLRLAQSRAVVWQGDLESAFGGNDLLIEPVIRVARLWSFKKPKRFTPERMIVDPKDPANRYLDFYKANSTAASPWVVVVHGGGWNGGDPRQMEELSFYLAERGYAVASVSYRLAPAAKWPTQRDDVATAVAYIKERHKELNLDPGRWAILGRSAGGQIAESVAYTMNDPALKGCVAFYAPADLHFGYLYAEEEDMINSRQLIRNLLGGSPAQVPAQFDDASPIRFAGKDSPPTLLLHGMKDPLTWYLQSRRLRDRITRAGGKCLLITLDWGTHGFDYNFNGPGGQIGSYAVEYFLSSVFSTPGRE